MDEPVGVEDGKPAGDVSADPTQRDRIETADVTEIGPVEHLHREVRLAVGDAVVVHLDEARVAQPRPSRGGTGLTMVNNYQRNVAFTVTGFVFKAPNVVS